MPRSILLLLSLLLASLASAQTADVRTTVTGPTRLGPGETANWTVTVENAGPDAASGIRVTSGLSPGRQCLEEEIATLAAGQRRTFSCAQQPAAGDYRLVMYASAFHSAADPNFQNNFGSQDTIVVTAADLQVFINAPFRIDRALPFDFLVLYRNRAFTAATGVRLTVTSSAEIVSAPAGCTIAGTTATCEAGTIAAAPEREESEFAILHFTARAPDESRAVVQLRSAIVANETDPFPPNNEYGTTTQTHPTTYVTNTNDSGSGSLRAAIEEVNSGCHANPNELCKIAFRIPTNGARWATIRTETPLPAITADRVVVDGSWQTRFADTNPDGPEVEISGERLTSGNGITITNRCSASVNNLTINGFPDNGILNDSGPCENPLGQGFYSIDGNYIGTDPTGTTAKPNLRGVMVAIQRYDVLSPTFLTRNVISGNRNSGVWVSTGSQTRIVGNVIGLTAGAKAPLGNGASGVYIGTGGTGTDVLDNYIGFNGHAGISLDSEALRVHVATNSFQGNGSLAIDYGLDGVTPFVYDIGERPGNVLHAPVITSARYDAASNATLVEGTVDNTLAAPAARRLHIAVYANDAPDASGFGEGQYYLGMVHADDEGRFRFVYPGRTPGQHIAATTSSFHILGFARTPGSQATGSGYATTTSEFSRTVEVSP